MVLMAGAMIYRVSSVLVRTVYSTGAWERQAKGWTSQDDGTYRGNHDAIEASGSDGARDAPFPRNSPMLWVLWIFRSELHQKRVASLVCAYLGSIDGRSGVGRPDSVYIVLVVLRFVILLLPTFLNVSHDSEQKCGPSSSQPQRLAQRCKRRRIKGSLQICKRRRIKKPAETVKSLSGAYEHYCPGRRTLAESDKQIRKIR